jgi:hypothetical protein
MTLYQFQILVLFGRSFERFHSFICIHRSCHWYKTGYDVCPEIINIKACLPTCFSSAGFTPFCSTFHVPFSYWFILYSGFWQSIHNLPFFVHALTGFIHVCIFPVHLYIPNSYTMSWFHFHIIVMIFYYNQFSWTYEVAYCTFYYKVSLSIYYFCCRCGLKIQIRWNLCMKM